MGILFTGCTSENTRTKVNVETDTTIETKKVKRNQLNKLQQK